jgi:phosphoribosylformylglycinamidine cyclo-ligase
MHSVSPLTAVALSRTRVLGAEEVGQDGVRGDGQVGFHIDELPPVPEIFELIQQYGSVSTAEMFEVYNMGVGFCVLVDPSKTSLVLSILEQHGRKAWVIGEAIEDPTKGVRVPRHRLVGHGKHFRQG